MKKIHIAALLLLLAGSFIFSSITYTSLPLILIQGTARHTIGSEYSRVLLDREHFTLQFTLEPRHSGTESPEVAAMTAVLDDYASLDAIQTGMRTEDTVNFSPGSGMAAAGAYDYLLLSSDGNHYVFYDTDPQISRADLVPGEGAFWQIQWAIQGVCEKISERFGRTRYGDETPFSRSTVKELFFAVFIDRNSNDIIDQGELYRFSVVFP